MKLTKSLFVYLQFVPALHAVSLALNKKMSLFVRCPSLLPQKNSNNNNSNNLNNKNDNNPYSSSTTSNTCESGRVPLTPPPTAVFQIPGKCMHVVVVVAGV